MGRTILPMSTLVTKRTIAYGPIVTTSLISSVPTLADFPGYTDFTALFDAYRIKRLTYKFFPTVGNVGQSQGLHLVGVLGGPPLWLGSQPGGSGGGAHRKIF